MYQFHGRRRCMLICLNKINFRTFIPKFTILILKNRPEKFAMLLDPEQRYLDLSVCRNSVTDVFFKQLKASPNLSKLVVRDCQTINNMCFTNIALVRTIFFAP